MTDKEHIQRLLDRFMMSETTIEEERRLKEYFSSLDDVPEEWTAFAVMIQGMSAGIQGMSAEKQNEGTTDGKALRSNGYAWKWITATAASIIAAVFALFLFLYQNNGETGKDKIAKTELPTISKPSEKMTVETEAIADAQEAAPEATQPPLPTATNRTSGKRHRNTNRKATKKVSPILPPKTTDSASPLPERLKEPTDDEIMAEYISSNFTPLEERFSQESTDATLKEFMQEETELQEHLNGIGKIINEYEL